MLKAHVGKIHLQAMLVFRFLASSARMLVLVRVAQLYNSGNFNVRLHLYTVSYTHLDVYKRQDKELSYVILFK